MLRFTILAVVLFQLSTVFGLHIPHFWDKEDLEHRPTATKTATASGGWVTPSGIWATPVPGWTPTPTPTPWFPWTPGHEAPRPLQPGTSKECTKFHRVGSFEDCSDIARKEGISMSEFHEWNTNVGGRRCNKLYTGYYVCVGI